MNLSSVWPPPPRKCQTGCIKLGELGAPREDPGPGLCQLQVRSDCIQLMWAVVEQVSVVLYCGTKCRAINMATWQAMEQSQRHSQASCATRPKVRDAALLAEFSSCLPSSLRGHLHGKFGQCRLASRFTSDQWSSSRQWKAVALWLYEQCTLVCVRDTRDKVVCLPCKHLALCSLMPWFRLNTACCEGALLAQRLELLRFCSQQLDCTELSVPWNSVS